MLLSVIAHGLSVGPLAARYGRRTTELPSDAPEIEPGPARVHWAGEGPTGPLAQQLALRHSLASMATASRSRSTYGSPLTSTATRWIVPPVNLCGATPA